MLETDPYFSRFDNQNIQDLSIEIGGLNEKIFLGLVSLKSNVSSGFEWVF